MRLVVIGGTGLIGSKVVAKLTEQGHEAVPASPRLGINSITGEGLAGAMEGTSVVVDVSNSQNFEYQTAMDFFQTSTRNLLAAEAAAGVGHHVALSVVGTAELAEGGDPVATTAGYFVAKRTQEELIKASGIPYTIVHATQFFEFISGIADASTTDGVVRVPPIAFQPMAADDVGAAVARAATGEPVNGIVEIGGPEPLRFEDAIRRVLAAADDQREVIADPAAGYYSIKVTERSLVPDSGAQLGETRLDDWLRQSAAAKSAVAAGT
jgi:uncharacterized protein YbjT (DUF2867 family)